MTSLDLLGLTAATLSSLSFIPQVVKTIRTRDTSSISLFMYSMFATGIFLWLVWGCLTGQVPIILANAVTFSLSAVILAMKVHAVLRHKERP